MNRLCLAICALCVMLIGQGSMTRASTSEPRIALVVGNAAYRNAPPLKNPVNDARDMARALRELGFDVITVENGSRQQLEHAIGQFSAKLTEGSVGLFYYSGHGIQDNGHNFLIPVDAELASEAAVRLETIDLDILLDLMNMAQTRVNLVILDACRSNPFERRFRGLGRGLAPVEQAPRGTLVAYSTAPGKIASDGDGANGLYTAELLKAIRRPGLKVEEVFKAVRIAVSKVSNDSQTPWESSSLTGDFFFQPPGTDAALSGTRVMSEQAAKSSAQEVGAAVAALPALSNEARMRSLASKQGINLPAAITLLPHASLMPAGRAEYLGAWGGDQRWGGSGRQIIVIVAGIDSSGVAVGWYAQGPPNSSTADQAPANYTSFSGSITDRGLVFNWGTSKYTFKVVGGLMWGHVEGPSPKGPMDGAITLGRID
jgi:hypothetical protein